MHTILDPRQQSQDSYEVQIRPKSLDEFIGQNSCKENLKIFLLSALARKKALDHTLLIGPPGLGKTTLAHIIANELEVPFTSTSGPVLEKKGDIAAILMSLEKNQVLFIDEIHRINRSVEEMFYSVMEDFTLDIMLDQGPGAKIVKVQILPFTLIGATTRLGLLTAPMRERFGIPLHLDFYETKELKTIVTRASSCLQGEIYDEASVEIAKRSRGTPRIANRLLRRVFDFAIVRQGGIIDLKVAQQALHELQIDSKGLDKLNRRILNIIAEIYNGGPVGIANLSAILSEEVDTLENYIEPYLLRIGYVQRTSKGRVLTELGRTHLEEFKKEASLLG